MTCTLLIGGGGFIGTHLAKALTRSNRKVIVTGRATHNQRLPTSIEYISNQILGGSGFEGILDSIDEVVYLAYSSVPQTSYDDPIKDIHENLSYAVNTFEFFKKQNLKKFVYVSSGGTVYGQANSLPIEEDHPTNPISPYGITKLAIEKYGMMYKHFFDLPIVIVRPSNVYGEGQRPFVGQGFIATAIAQAIKKEKIKIFGKDGTIRDYVYVDDVVEGLLALLDFGVAGEIYNLGSSLGHTNLEVVDILNKIGLDSNVVFEYELREPRPFDVRENILDTRRIHSLCGWIPSTKLEKGLQKSFEWYMDNL
jgi:UDP-glucose 4-epimerase